MTESQWKDAENLKLKCPHMPEAWKLENNTGKINIFEKQESALF
jgi:hypothetical protein